MKTPGTSSVTKFHNRVFKFHTCCGILELNCLKVTSMIALMVILIAFCSLVAIIAINYSVVTGLYSKVEFLQSDATHYRELMKISSRIAAITDYNRTLSLQYVDAYNYLYTKYYESINTIGATVPDDVIYYRRMNISREDLLSRKAVKVELEVIDTVVNHANYTKAQQLIDSDYYQYLLSGYPEEVQTILDYVKNVKESYTNLNLTTTTIALVIIVVSLIVVIPVISVFVLFSVKKDNTKEKQLRQVRKYMIMDTINDSVLSEKFKEFCGQERSEDNFLLLDKINDYKRLCERSFDIQVYLFDAEILSATNNSDLVSETTTTTTSSTEEASKKKKKKGYSEKDLFDMEKKKYEVAFEIYTDFLDVRGDRSVNINKQVADNVKQFLDFFAKGENDQLPESLFDYVESEMCILMMDTHHRFKAHIESQLKDRKKTISSLKKKKK